MNLFFAILIGTALGVFTSLRRHGGIVTFIASIASFGLALGSFHFQLIGFFTSGGGVGLLLVIIGLYVKLAIWAHQLVQETRNTNSSD